MILYDLVEFAYIAGGFTTKSDFARDNATLVAEAASEGLISTETPRDGYGNVWRVTPEGLDMLLCPCCQEDATVDTYLSAIEDYFGPSSLTH